MKILIAPDSFKDALDSVNVGKAISKGIKLANPNIETKVFPLADGGEGTLDILRHHLGGMKRSLFVCDPLFRKIKTDYLITEDGKTAFIELAKSSGLQLLNMSERNPMHTSTYGFGELIRDALSQGVKKIVLAIGGSATNDAGIGMACALGYRFYDGDGHLLKGVGSDLIKIVKIEKDADVLHRLSMIEISVICDVKNPLYGPKGAAFVFAQQKGASNEECVLLDQGLQNISQVLKNKVWTNTEGAGAAGGLGFGAMAFLKASLNRGIDIILKLTKFDEGVKTCDMIFTGEGSLDAQTYHGKLIQGVVSIAGKHNVPVIAICGSIKISSEEIKKMGLLSAFSLSDNEATLELALQNTSQNLISKAYSIIHSLYQDG